ncbi:MAG TPA: N,N-dimethylformamidase beta subunit family domain-containing protein, partial [Streptosporangiaceae bacterium]|nr:N,N-dimethylformamidase beta subunit family domain-containing protein [Streptosporangiaceae bacterium]
AAATSPLWWPSGSSAPAAAPHPAATLKPTPRPRGTTTASENSHAGDPHWVIRHLGDEHEIEGYAGRASVQQGEPFPLYVSTTSSGYRVTAYRLGWYQGIGARRVWQSGALHGHVQADPETDTATNTVRTSWDPVLSVPTDDWPAGSYLLLLDADSGAQRYVPVTVRSASTAGKVVVKNCVETWQAYNTWGGYDLYKGPQGAYADRSLVVSLDRPYGDNGASMFLTYERNAIKLAEYLGLPLAYVTSMDLATEPGLLTGASALLSMGHDEYWSPPERANVTAARNAGVNLAFLGANAMFRRTRLQSSALGANREVVCYKTSYTKDPMYGKDNAQVTGNWRDAPSPEPESSVIGTLYESYPADAGLEVASPSSWVFKGTSVPGGTSFPHLVGVEYDRVNPGYPLERPIEVLSHSPLVCNGVSSYADSAYYTHAAGAGVFNSGTMRWVEALYGDQPHGIGNSTAAFVRQVSSNIFRAFADGPAASRYPAHDNLDAMHEYAGDRMGAGSALS